MAYTSLTSKIGSDRRPQCLPHLTVKTTPRDTFEVVIYNSEVADKKYQSTTWRPKSGERSLTSIRFSRNTPSDISLTPPILSTQTSQVQHLQTPKHPSHRCWYQHPEIHLSKMRQSSRSWSRNGSRSSARPVRRTSI